MYKTCKICERGSFLTYLLSQSQFWLFITDPPSGWPPMFKVARRPLWSRSEATSLLGLDLTCLLLNAQPSFKFWQICTMPRNTTKLSEMTFEKKNRYHFLSPVWFLSFDIRHNNWSFDWLIDPLLHRPTFLVLPPHFQLPALVCNNAVLCLKWEHKTPFMERITVKLRLKFVCI